MNTSNPLPNTPSIPTNYPLLQAWTYLFENPSELSMRAFIQALYVHLEQKQMNFYNHGALNTPINHDLSLMALSKISSGLLMGNRHLMLVTHVYLESSDVMLGKTKAVVREDLINQLDLCCNVGLKYAARQIRRKENKIREKAEKILHAFTEMHQLQIDFPTDSPDDVPIENRIETVERIISKALRAGKIKPSAAELLLMAISQGKSQAEIARLRKISESAVSQQLSALAKKLRPLVANSEWQ